MSEEIKQSMPQKQKILLIALIAGGIIAAIYMFVLTPMYEDYAKYTKDAEAIIARTDSARKEISDVTKMNANFDSLSAYLDPITNNYVVREKLGSYPMERRINEIASPLNLKASCSAPRKEKTPVNKVEAPKGRKASKNAAPPVPVTTPCFDRLVIDLDLEGSYFAVVKLMETLESENPFCGVKSFKITPNPSSPEKHKFSISLEWPVDADKPQVHEAKGRK